MVVPHGLSSEHSLLEFFGLFHDALIGNLAFEKAAPFLIRKLIVVQQF